MSIKIVVTDDGSSSLYSEEAKDVYHSTHGALTESKFIFIERGLNQKLLEIRDINILEVGFGTGLNAILTYQTTSKINVNTLYDTIEPFPIPHAILKELYFPGLTENHEIQNILYQMHNVTDSLKINQYFEFRFFKQKLEDIQLVGEKYDLVYFDAFSPEVCPELWTLEIFSKIHRSMKKDGLLLTYSAKGQVRRNLQSAGFIVERLNGPKGKREILRAKKISD